jgi:hypothetical protein
LLTFAGLHRDAILEDGLLTESELTGAVNPLRAHLSDPGTLVIYPLLVQAWGHKPDA